MRILIDMDNVIYDIDTPWIALHNKEYPDHIIQVSDYTEWDRKILCTSVGCAADIYKYLDTKEVWNKGIVIEGAQEILLQWYTQEHELAVVTAVGNSIAPNRKISWLQSNFPYIRNIFITYGRNKDWIIGDVLIDDAVHNLEHFTGISILYAQPWNASNRSLPRAKDWNHINKIINRVDVLLRRNTYTHKFIQRIVYTEIEEGIL